MKLRYHNKVITLTSVPKIYSRVKAILFTLIFIILTKEIVDRIRIVDFPRIYGDEQGPINFAKIFAGYPVDVYTGYLPGLGLIYALPFYVFDNFYFAYKSSQLINLVIYLLGAFLIFKVNRVYLSKEESAFLTLSVVSYIGITSRVAYLMTETITFFVLSLVLYLVIKKDYKKVNYNLAIIMLAMLNTIHSRYMIALIPTLLSLVIIIIKKENISLTRFIKEHKTKIIIFFTTLFFTQVFNGYMGSTGRTELASGFFEFLSSLKMIDILFIISTICLGIVIFLMHSYFLSIFALTKLTKYQNKFTNLEYMFCLIFIWLFYTTILQSVFFAKYAFSGGLEYQNLDNISTFIYQSRYYDSFIPALFTLSYIIIKKNTEIILKFKSYIKIITVILIMVLLPVNFIVELNGNATTPGDHVSYPFAFAFTSQDLYSDRMDLLIITFALISSILGIFLYFSRNKLTVLTIITIAQIFCLGNYNSWDIGITNTPNFNNKIITSEVNRNLKEKQGYMNSENLCVLTNLGSESWWFNSKYSIYFDFSMKYSDNPSAKQCILILNIGEMPGNNVMVAVDELNNHFLYERRI